MIIENQAMVTDAVIEADQRFSLKAGEARRPLAPIRAKVATAAR
jgi:hypothetical protein